MPRSICLLSLLGSLSHAGLGCTLCRVQVQAEIVLNLYHLLLFNPTKLNRTFASVSFATNDKHKGLILLQGQIQACEDKVATLKNEASKTVPKEVSSNGHLRSYQNGQPGPTNSFGLTIPDDCTGFTHPFTLYQGLKSMSS